MAQLGRVELRCELSPVQVSNLGFTLSALLPPILAGKTEHVSVVRLCGAAMWTWG